MNAFTQFWLAMMPHMNSIQPEDIEPVTAQQIIEESDMAEMMTRRWLAENKQLKTADQVMKFFLDEAYSGKHEELSPQFPRAKVEAVINKVKREHPMVWYGAAKHLGLTA